MSRKDRHFGDEDSTLNTEGERGESVNTEGDKGIGERGYCGTLKVWGRKWTYAPTRCPLGQAVKLPKN